MSYALDRPVNRPGRPVVPRLLAGAVVILSLGVAANGATAQTENRLAQAQSPAGQKPGTAQRQAQPAGDPVEGQLAEIKKRLNITAAQQPQFEQFANTLKQNARATEAMMRKAGESAEQSALDGLRTAASFAQAEADGLKRLVPALEALYASLSDEQKRIADKLFSNAPPPAAAPKGATQKPRG